VSVGNIQVTSENVPHVIQHTITHSREENIAKFDYPRNMRNEKWNINYKEWFMHTNPEPQVHQYKAGTVIANLSDNREKRFDKNLMLC